MKTVVSTDGSLGQSNPAGGEDDGMLDNDDGMVDDGMKQDENGACTAVSATFSITASCEADKNEETCFLRDAYSTCYDAKAVRVPVMTGKMVRPIRETRTCKAYIVQSAMPSAMTSGPETFTIFPVPLFRMTAVSARDRFI